MTIDRQLFNLCDIKNISRIYLAQGIEKFSADFSVVQRYDDNFGEYFSFDLVKKDPAKNVAFPELVEVRDRKRVGIDGQIIDDVDVRVMIENLTAVTHNLIHSYSVISHNRAPDVEGDGTFEIDFAKRVINVSFSVEVHRPVIENPIILHELSSGHDHHHQALVELNEITNEIQSLISSNGFEKDDILIVINRDSPDNYDMTDMDDDLFHFKSINILNRNKVDGVTVDGNFVHQIQKKSTRIAQLINAIVPLDDNEPNLDFGLNFKNNIISFSKVNMTKQILPEYRSGEFDYHNVENGRLFKVGNGYYQYAGDSLTNKDIVRDGELVAFDIAPEQKDIESLNLSFNHQRTKETGIKDVFYVHDGVPSRNNIGNIDIGSAILIQDPLRACKDIYLYLKHRYGQDTGELPFLMSVTDEHGNSPIHYLAALDGNHLSSYTGTGDFKFVYKMISYIHDHGYSFDMENNAGMTPLMMAIKSQNNQAIQSLLECGASATLKNNDGISAYDMMQSVLQGEMKFNDASISLMEEAYMNETLSSPRRIQPRF